MANKNIILAIKFEYALLEFYKQLYLTENEVMILLMINHLLDQKNVFISPDLLAIKMNLNISDIDQLMASLVKRGYVVYKTVGTTLTTSLDPLIERLSNLYQIEMKKQTEKEFNEEAKKSLKNIYEIFEKELGRSLSPIELSLIEEWVNSGFSEDDCVDALHECVRKKKLSLRAVDKILLQRQSRKDVEEEGHSAINGVYKVNIKDTIDKIEKNIKDNNNGNQ